MLSNRWKQLASCPRPEMSESASPLICSLYLAGCQETLMTTRLNEAAAQQPVTNKILCINQSA